ncbi:unnamed protein product, partial [Closterium sp. NIES-54]
VYPLPSPPASSLPALADPASDSLHAASPTVARFLATAVTDPSFESAAALALVAELVDFAAHCRLDYAAILVAESASVCPPSVRGVLTPLSGRQPWMQRWLPRSPQAPTSTRFPHLGRTSQRQGVDYFHTFSPTPKMTTLRVLLHVAAQRDYELHSLDFSTAFLQGSLHEEIWLRRPPDFTGSFPPVLYVDNKDMLALCREHKLEHRTKHIALRYFLARELQQRGQLRLAYVASQANTADIFTKALQPCDHQRFCTMLGLVPTLPHLLTS